ncbi:MAG TPA: alpha/beta hydrolase [Steroidobacteraceae bacterium]|nr:alpha/beta hydrolase [Steroidobacteraceae bacterium]
MKGGTAPPRTTLHRHRIDGRELDCRHIGAGAAAGPALVFLHDGLGSIGLWREFPARLAAATGANAIVYSRYGNGHSNPLQESRSVAYMHDEALVVLPELLALHGIERPVLIGHSDGASIAIIYAGAFPQHPTALIAIAPHLFVEPRTLSSIAALRPLYESTPLRERMGRHHADVDRTFYGWNEIWLHPSFAAWNIEQYAAKVRCPALAVQGCDDEYGTMRQVENLRELARQVRLAQFENCGHSPHRDQPERLLEECAAFLRSELALIGA